MIETWKIDMVNHINRIAYDGSISPSARERCIRHVYRWYRLARYVSASRLNAIESTEDTVEKWLAGVTAPNLHEQNEAANQVDIPECDCRGCKKTHRQKTRIKALARSFLRDPSTADKPDGHESRMVAMVEACKANRLPDELTLVVMDLAEPIQMYHHHFVEPGQQRWESEQDRERKEAEKAAARAKEVEAKKAEKEAGRTMSGTPRSGQAAGTVRRGNAVAPLRETNRQQRSPLYIDGRACPLRPPPPPPCWK